jgi:hypothetical protein
MQHVRSPEIERLWTLNYCSIRSGEYLNLIKRHWKMTIHCKRRCLPKFARLITSFWELPHKKNQESRGNKNQESRPPKSGSLDVAKLTQVVFDLKAEMGTMRKSNDKGRHFISLPISLNQGVKPPAESRKARQVCRNSEEIESN